MINVPVDVDVWYDMAWLGHGDLTLDTGTLYPSETLSNIQLQPLTHFVLYVHLGYFPESVYARRTFHLRHTAFVNTVWVAAQRIHTGQVTKVRLSCYLVFIIW